MTGDARKGSIPRGLLAGVRDEDSLGRWWPGSLQATLELPQTRREQPLPSSVSAEELTGEGEPELRHELEAVGPGDVAGVDAGHCPVHDQRAEVAGRGSFRVGTEPAQGVDEADPLSAGVRGDRSVRRELNGRRLSRAGRHRGSGGEQAVGRVPGLTGQVTDDDYPR